MKASAAARIIGCTPAHVRLLIRKGKIKGAVRRRVTSPYKQHESFEYDIPESEVIRISESPFAYGRPRLSRTKA